LHGGDPKIIFGELVRNVPAERPEQSSLLDDGMEEAESKAIDFEIFVV
jgi:hypothetical protein